ncbi:uncharacterized protein LODBEIA_P41920 [Lodderomyces beijingensis]|uniref:Triacylglycerol lipase n=1 Tax=Lodderomyces beijingensis TaxID=1775926 RepID=A0ABP0ZP89_9ASCO
MNPFLLLAFFVSTAFAAAPPPLVPPSEDEFYQAPARFEDEEIGTILKIRSPPRDLRSIYLPINIKNAWQIMVRSSDSFGQPNYIVTTIMEPYNADPGKVLSYQTFQDSADIDCSPSYGMLQGAPMSTLATQIDMTFVVLALQSGYYVVSPDYEGPKSTFAVGRQSGYATLDSIRATLHSGNFTGISNDAKVAMWGYSGGSVASGWAASLQSRYAPELKENLIGVALGGLVANITAVAEAVDNGLFSGLIPVALHGLANEYPHLKDLMDIYVDPAQADALDYAAHQCLFGAVLNYVAAPILKGKSPMFPGGVELLQHPQIAEILHENCLVCMNETYVPEMPVFVYHGTLDQVIPIKDVRNIYKNWCDWGIESLEFTEGVLGTHITETLVGAPAAWTWLERRFAGEEPVRGCQHDARLQNFFYPNASSTTLDYFTGLFDAFMYGELGAELVSNEAGEAAGAGAGGNITSIVNKLRKKSES